MNKKYFWQQIPSPLISEIFCSSKKIDGIVLDLEHGVFNNENIFSCIQVVTLSGKECFVRLGSIHRDKIKYVLDAGCTGIIFSTIETIEQCRKIYELCYYPSSQNGSKRGQGLVRENLWGKIDNLNKRKPKVIIQIETMKGAKGLKKLINEHLFDYYLIGLYDLSASCGSAGNFQSEDFQLCISWIEHYLPKNLLGIHLPKNEKSLYKNYKDYGFVAFGMDTTFLVDKIEQIENIF